MKATICDLCGRRIRNLPRAVPHGYGFRHLTCIRRANKEEGRKLASKLEQRSRGYKAKE